MYSNARRKNWVWYPGQEELTREGMLINDETESVWEPVFFKVNEQVLLNLERLNYYNPNDCVTNAFQALGLIDQRIADFVRILTPNGVFLSGLPSLMDVIFEREYKFELSELEEFDKLLSLDIKIPPGYMAFARLDRGENPGHAFIIYNPVETYRPEMNVHSLLRYLVIDPQVQTNPPYGIRIVDYIRHVFEPYRHIAVLGIYRQRNVNDPPSQTLISFSGDEHYTEKRFKPADLDEMEF